MKASKKITLPGLGLLAAGIFAIAALAATDDSKSGPSGELRSYLEVLRSDFNTSKIATINQAMKLTAPEAEKFWPIYRSYEKDLAAVGDRKLALIQEFASLHFSGGLDDRNAKDLAEGWLDNTQQRLDLWKKYHRQISRAVSPVRAAQFLQIENQMALFVDITIASEMPAVAGKKAGSP